MTLRILAVDDSRTMRDMVKAALASAGFEVHTADDGVHGLEVLNECTPDVIITDINMPRMDGFGFIESVRSIDQYKQVPILTLTTESAPELKQRARDAGATGWIVKPFDDASLVSVLRRLTGHVV